MAGGRLSRGQGFTLIELVITVAIVALLASVALPVSELAVQRTKEQELRRTLRQIRDAIDMYKQSSDEGRIRKSIDRKSTRLNSSHDQISYAVFCLKKKKKKQTSLNRTQ